MSEKPKQPAWRKQLYQPQPPHLNLSDISPEEADAHEEARLAAYSALAEEEADSKKG